MESKNSKSGVSPPTLDTAHETLWRILNSKRIHQHRQFIEAELHGNDIEVTVQPEGQISPVTLRLKIVGAAVIPSRPRRKRKTR